MGKNIFCEENVVLNSKADDKWDAIRKCGRILVEQGYVSEAYIDDMLERERGACVYVGNHVAIPHGIAGSENKIFHSGISFLQVPDGVEFNGETAYLLIGIAGKDGEHIELLGKIAMICSDMDHVETLRTAKTAEAVCRIFQEMLEQ